MASQHNNHLLGTLGRSAFNRLRHMDFVGPLLRADRITVQRIHHGVAAILGLRVTGRQKYEHIAVRGIAFQVAF